jgi:CheY-like chemotaxis protein
MPGMGGLDICSRIRSQPELDRVKIVILTGYPGGGNPEKSLLYGADLFLTKPQDVDTLRAHVRDLLEG